MRINNRMLKVLVAEDDENISSVLAEYLKKECFEVRCEFDGEAAFRRFQQEQIDVVILDIKMPKLDGQTLLSRIRLVSNVPIIMLTAMDSEFDKVYSLNIGADDYVVKPFLPGELIARINAMLRRVNYYSDADNRKVLRSKNIEINLNEHRVCIGVDKIDMGFSFTQTEFRILCHLVRHPDRVFSRKEILESCLSTATIDERTVDSHISNLRKKIEEKTGLKYIPEGVRGVGYRLGDL